MWRRRKSPSSSSNHHLGPHERDRAIVELREDMEHERDRRTALINYVRKHRKDCEAGGAVIRAYNALAER